MKRSRVKYLFVYVTPLVVILSIASESFWSFGAIVFIFVLLPLIELFMPASEENMSLAEEELAKKDIFYDLLVYSLVPLQYGIMLFFLFSVSQFDLPLYVKIGMTTAFGMSCGILGINAAHELGHRASAFEQMMSKMLLLTTLYMHFFIEHNRGHHKQVSTDDDPASARYGESLYAFFVRSVRDSWLSAWKLEAVRLKRAQLPVMSLKNEMLRFQLLQLGLLVFIAVFFGIATMFYFIAAAVIGFLLLETVNYIEHYGLRRKKKGKGYERTMPVHSWNSNHPLGRLVLLELSRHSDHHYMANRKYQTLRHFDESPQMPTGYPGMMLIAFIPPLWFKVMHPRIEHFKKTNQGAVLA